MNQTDYNNKEIQDNQDSKTLNYAGESTSKRETVGLQHAVENASILKDELLKGMRLENKNKRQNLIFYALILWVS